MGSTCEGLSVRMAKHRRSYKSYLKGKGWHLTVYNLFDEFGLGNCRIEWVEDYPCNNQKELRAREGRHIRKCDCVNKYIAGRTEQMRYYEHHEEELEKRRVWRAENVERKRAMNKQYRENNKEEIIAQLKEKRMCECGCSISLRNMSSHKKTAKHIELMKLKTPETE